MNLVLTPEQQEEHWRSLDMAKHWLKKAIEYDRFYNEENDSTWRMMQAMAFLEEADAEWRKIVIEQKQEEFQRLGEE